MVIGERECSTTPRMKSIYELIMHLSRQLCCLLVCTTNHGHPARRAQRDHRVRPTSPRVLQSVLILRSAILASYLLDEQLGHLGRVGCALCILGSVIIVMHAPEDKEINTVDEVLHYAIQTGTPTHPSIRAHTHEI